MNEAELNQIKKLHTWDLVVPPLNANNIPSKYTFHQKCNENGKITCFKALLVTKGFKQQFGVNYTETYALTIHPATLQILLSFVAQNNATVHQADVKNAYLNAPLQNNEVIYMQLPLHYDKY